MTANSSHPLNKGEFSCFVPIFIQVAFIFQVLLPFYYSTAHFEVIWL